MGGKLENKAMHFKKRNTPALVFMMILLTGMLFSSTTLSAANWINLPPYNTLWPLWSPALSPANPVTGIPTPIVSTLAPATRLPVQPGLTWDPRVKYPWLLYNAPGGMCYFDPLYGVQTWPPAYLKNTVTSLPLPINLSLIKGWSLLLPTSTAWLTNNVPLGNYGYILTYPSSVVSTTPPLSSLLTAALILGLGPVIP